MKPTADRYFSSTAGRHKLLHQYPLSPLALIRHKYHIAQLVLGSMPFGILCVFALTRRVATHIILLADAARPHLPNPTQGFFQLLNSRLYARYPCLWPHDR